MAAFEMELDYGQDRLDVVFAVAQLLARMNVLEVKRIDFNDGKAFVHCHDAEFKFEKIPTEDGSYIKCQASGSNPELKDVCNYMSHVWILITNRSCNIKTVDDKKAESSVQEPMHP